MYIVLLDVSTQKNYMSGHLIGIVRKRITKNRSAFCVAMGKMVPVPGHKFFFSPGPEPKMTGPAHV
jgi:hypothetical protein